VTAGASVSYTITLTNTGPSAAINVALTEKLPASETLLSESQISGPDTFTNNSAAPSVIFNAATVGSGNTDTFLVTARVGADQSAGATISATAVATANNAPSVVATTPNATVSVSADLAVSKTGAASVTAGTSATYTITLTNNGPSDSSNVVVTDTLPDGLSLVSATQLSGPDAFTSTSTGNTPRFNATTVRGDNTDIFQVVAFAASGLAQGTPLSDTASVASSTADPNIANNTFTFGSSVVTSADLSITKTGPAVITAGAAATYTITLTNNGPSDASTVILTDTLPSGLSLASAKQIGGTDPFVSRGNGPAFSAGAVIAGHTDIFQIVARAASGLSAGTSLSDTASVSSTTSDPNPSNNSSTFNSTVATSADLSVSKSGPATITAGTSATYTIFLTNRGPSDAQAVSLTDALPTGLNLVLATQIAGSDKFTNTSAGNTASFTATSLVAGHADVFRVVASTSSSLASGTAVTETATVSSTTADSNPANNSATVNSTVATVADLAVVKTGPPVITAGATATFTITLTNLGPSDAQTVSLTDTLPSGFTEVLASATTNPDGFTTTTPVGSSTVTFTATTAKAGNTDIFQVVAAAPSGLANLSTVTNKANVTSPTTDPNPANNASSDTATVTTSADLSVVKTGPTTVTAGTSITYTITVTDNGPSDAQAVSLTDALPTGLNFVSAMQTSGPDSFSNTSTGNTASFTATTVVAGHTDVFAVIAFAPSSLASGTALPDTAKVSATTADPNSANNTSTVNSTVATVADLAVTKTGPATATEGDTITYTVTLTNIGPSDAQGVTLTDTLPAQLNLLSATASTGTVTTAGKTVTVSVGTVAASQAPITLTMVVQVAEDGTPINTATVTSTTTDSNPANNTAMASTAVSEPGIALTVLGVSATEFAPLTNVPVATFQHANGAESAGGFAATINWGDGSVTTGTVTQVGSTYTVLGNHTYNFDGSHTVTVAVVDDNASAHGSSTANVAEGTLPAGALSTPLTEFVNETTDDAFNQPVSLFQLNNLTLALTAVELSAAQVFVANGQSQSDAVQTAFTLGQFEYTLLTAIVAFDGATLDSAASLMANVMLLQSITEPLGLD
jgi:uncharacterized repeat protein (TIGR01451 family)